MRAAHFDAPLFYCARNARATPLSATTSAMISRRPNGSFSIEHTDYLNEQGVTIHSYRDLAGAQATYAS
jgi:hypothetical protein